MRCKSCDKVIPSESIYRIIEGEQVLEELCHSCRRDTTVDENYGYEHEYFHIELTRRGSPLY
jgi:MinD superfamily P-loop ATPase